MIIGAYWFPLKPIFVDSWTLFSCHLRVLHDSTGPCDASHIQRPRGHIQIQVDVEEASSAKLPNSKGGPFFSGLLVKNQGFSHWFMDVLHSWLLALVMENNWNWICEWIYQHFTVKNEDQIYIYILHTCAYIYITHVHYIYRAHIISMYIYI